MYSIDDLRPIIDRVRTDITAKKMPNGSSVWCKSEPLTSERIQEHLNGTQLRGVCPIHEGDSNIRLALLDLDSHKGETSWDDMLQVAQNIYDDASRQGVYFEVFHSSGGKGVHLIAIWDEPQDAYSVRQLLMGILNNVGYRNGAGGVAKKEIEVFPKQDRVPERGCGNQFILPITEIQWLRSKPVQVLVKPAPQPKEYARFDDKDEKMEAISALKAISPDIPYPEWVNVGMALKDKFGTSGFQLWDAWSSGGTSYESSNMWGKWQSFKNHGITIATMYDVAMLNGWRHESVARPDVDTSIVNNIMGQVASKKDAIQSIKTIPPQQGFGFDILTIKGIIGDTVRSMNKYALYKQPELYLINTIVAAGAVFGRRYASPMNARTNLYMVGIARTAGGKDFSRQFLPLLFEKAGLSEFCGAHYIRSDTGMLVDLQNTPSQVLMLDEFGMYLEAITNQRAPSHFRNISSCITRLFTSSGTFYDHGNTADAKSRITIARPNLCIYGTTTEESYASALKRTAIASGDLNRFLVYKSSRSFTGEEEMPPAYEIENDLVGAWNLFTVSGIGNLSSLPPEPIVVQWNDEIKSMIQDCAIKQNTMINEKTQNSELWGRYAELVTKIAMVFAISENQAVPYFKPWHVEYARNIVDTCLNYMASLASESVADSEYEGLQQKVIRFLKVHKNGVTMTELNNRFRSVKSKERREMLVDMVSQGVIIIEKITDKSIRPKEIIRIKE
jgi:hypothetical protein